MWGAGINSVNKSDADGDEEIDEYGYTEIEKRTLTRRWRREL